MWVVTAYATRSGTSPMILEPAAASWSRRLTGSGSGSCTFALRDTFALPSATMREVLRQNGRTLAFSWGGEVAFAGVIQSTSYDRPTGMVTAELMELRGLLSKRMTGGVNQYGAPWNRSYTGKSAVGAVRAVLQWAQSPSSEWTLPIDLPPDGTGPLARSVDFYETVTIDDLLKEIEEQANVTVDFRPYVTSAGLLRWETRVVGPATVYGVTDLPVTVEGSLVNGLRVVEDGTKQVTGILALGNGTGEDMLTAFAPTSGSGATAIPVRDEKRSSKDLKDKPALQRFADAEYAKWSVVRESWSFNAMLGDNLTPEQLSPGRQLRMDVRGDDWLPDGLRTRRVIALSGDLSMTVTPEVDDGS